ncbi:DUF434 domain-containing protein [Clostridium sp. YIM B02515]|uniref:DUF434 domain-containing protein n=1 Tax=Clostridium rhizosphaerae TaxID=2803861 RepID=A0ABS1T5Q3_9CLOT|nr:DUF434 domain-containing protein [Clostridium rhizosphaerae]MBL4934586.1 DUF434 domain-containing protein [Clostridium rhizosphaerae]
MTEEIKEAGKSTRRGFDAEDYKWFRDNQVDRLKTAQEEVKWLLDRGYKMSSIIELAGGHYQFSARQRTALLRGTASEAQSTQRSSKLISFSEAKDGCIYIDGFNLIITLEVALSNSVLILGNDGCIRDLAGLRGTYKIIDKTEKALALIMMELKKLNILKASFYLDAPVSNSGRLKSKILEYAEKWKVPVEVILVPNADPILESMERVVTSDSVILDKCESWLNLSRGIIENYIDNAWIIDLNSSLQK